MVDVGGEDEETGGALRIVALELPARHGDPDAQLLALDAALSSLGAGPPTLVVLPELALTGYVSARGDFDVSRFAEPAGGPLLARVAALATARGVSTLVSWVEREGRRVYNSASLVDESGRVVLHYRKRHPWYPETWATRGDLGSPSVTLHGVRLTVAVCFDVHFVSKESGAALDAADALLFPSAWVDDGRTDLRAEVLPPIATRHRCAVVNANWGPGAPRVAGQGGSRVVRPGGVTLDRAATLGGTRAVEVVLRGAKGLATPPGSGKGGPP